MALLFINEVYNGGNSLSQNVGDWVDSEVKFLHFVEYESKTIQKSIISHSVNGVWWFELLDGSDWSEHGLADGKTVSVTSSVSGVPTVVVVVVDYLDGEKIFFQTDPTSLVDGQYPTFNPNTTVNTFITLEQTSAPEKIEFDFNLTKTNTPSLPSLIDGEINRFKSGNISALLVGGTALLSQINNKSGGLIEDVELTVVSINGGERVYRINFKFLNWAFLQSGYSEPQWFNGVDTIGAVNRLRVLAEFNNPNTVMTATSQNIFGDVGGFNENYNTGNETYSLSSVTFKDNLDVAIEGISYCGLTKFTAVINAPVGQLDTVQSRFNIGIAWRPVNDTYYQHKLFNLGHNLGVSAPDVDFLHSVTPDVTVYNGYNNSVQDFSWSFTNLQFEIVGDTIEVSGEIYPTVDNSFFDTIGVGEKKHTLWVSSYRNDIPNNQRLRCSTKVYDSDVICPPVFGVELKVQGFEILDHNQNVITKTTTEDDVKVSLAIELTKNTTYDNLKVGFQMHNTVTDEVFNLEQFNFNFASIPYIGGIYQANETIQRNFNLPPTSDRNVITTKLSTTFIDPSLYALDINYGWLNDWRYWLEKSNVNDDFYDITQPNNGLNKDWQRLSVGTNWEFRLEILLTKDDVSDFYYEKIEIRPYEDEDITESTTYLDLINGTTPNSLVANTEIQATTELTWNAGVYEPILWAEVTIEDFESGNRWLLSSILPQGNISSNPLKSVIASDKLELITVGNVATLRYKVDTNIISVDNVSISTRIFSGLGITEFRDRVIADGGTFEAQQCLTTIINNLI